MPAETQKPATVPAMHANLQHSGFWKLQSQLCNAMQKGKRNLSGLSVWEEASTAAPEGGREGAHGLALACRNKAPTGRGALG